MCHRCGVSLAQVLVLVAGSANSDVAPDWLDETLAYVRDLTRLVVLEGGGLVVFTGAPEPTNASGQPLIFDWVVLEEVERVADAGKVSVVAVTSAKLRGRMPADRAALLERLVAQGVAQLVMIPDDIHTGGNIGDAQAAAATAMIAIGGGRGVSDRAAKMMKKRATIIPIDVRVDGASSDGGGSSKLYQDAVAAPERFMPLGPETLRDALPTLALHGNGRSLAVNATLAVLQQAAAQVQATRPPQVLVLTALPVELEATKVALGGVGAAQKTAIGTNVWMTDLASRVSPSGVRVALACIGAAGNVAAATITTELVTTFRPPLVVMVGIAAGIRSKCEIGDVVLSERVAAYESAAVIAPSGIKGVFARLLGLRAGRSEPRPEMYRLAHAIEQDLVAYLAASEELSSRLAGALSEVGTLPSTAQRKIRPRLATIASGEKLLRDPGVLAGLRREMHGRIEIGEMEAAGVSEACRRLGADCLVVRGVSDFGDTKKTDDGHLVASAGAAVVCVDFLREGLRTSPRKP